MEIRILFLGDVVGRPGRSIIQDKLPELTDRFKTSLVIANGENVAGGSGITPKLAEEVFEAGVDIITMGDHVWKKKEIIPELEHEERIVRPANYPEGAAGRGWVVAQTEDGYSVGVVNLLGRVFMPPIDSPFNMADRAIKEISKEANIIIVDMHAEATSEKVAMGWHLDGRVSAVLGTHTHVQTADECILPNGTAYITDVGMTGPYDSIIGRRKDRVLRAILTGMPTPFDVAKGDVRLCGALISVDTTTGRATSIERVRESC